MSVASQVTDMNALPLKNLTTPQELIDDLIADFGFRKVFLAIFARILRGTRPPDVDLDQPRISHPDLDHLPDQIREDIGLPPKRRDDDLHLLAGYSSRHWL